MSGLPENPQVASMMFLTGVMITLLGPALVVLVLVVLLASPEWVAFVASWEWRFSQSMGWLGSAPLWNLSRDLLDVFARWQGAAHAGFSDPMGQHLWPTALYRLLIAGISLLIFIPMSFGAWRAGQAIAIGDFAPKAHRARWSFQVLTWSFALPGILAVLPLPIAAPISIPLAMCAMPVSAYILGRNVPFEV